MGRRRSLVGEGATRAVTERVREHRALGGRALGVLAAVAALLALAFAAAPASAAPYGQLESWGKFGTGAGEFSSPLMAGVDPSDGSLYVGDLTKESAATEDREYYRIQKLDPTGTPLASVEIPRYSNIPTNTKIVGLWGIAVDPALDRLYLLEGGREKETFGEIVAKKILVFSTVPKEGKLVPPEGGPATLPVPPAGAAGLYKPRGIQVDPSTGDLVIMAENKSAPKLTRFQRISSSGVTGKVFVDAAKAIRTGTETAFTFTVGPDGTIYTMTGTPKLAGKGHTRAWEVPPSMESIGMVPGFAEAADSEEWSYGFESAGEGTSSPQSALAGGPEIAISPGETLYWKERIVKSEELTAGNMLVRGFSLDDLATTVVYGGGEAGKCKIETSPAGLGTVGGKVVVFDYGPLNEEKSLAPAYGPKVRTYGPGGSDCLAPVAKFKANGVEGDVKVKKGDTVSFDASPSELGSGPGKATPGFRRELVWDFGDGSEETIKGEGGGEAPLTASHKYTVAGTFEASLQIRLKNPHYGNPATVSHKVEVEGAVAKEFVLKVSKNGSGSGTVTSSPAGISCGGDCEESYLEGTLVKLTGTPDAGSKAVEWESCPGTVNGENKCEVTMDAAKEAKATFDLEPAFYTLTVSKNGSGSGTVTSSPAGISCGGDCEESYLEGTLVKLTGTPDAGSKAVEWESCPGTVNGENKCEVTMDAAKEAKATFDKEPVFYTLGISTGGSGSGTVECEVEGGPAEACEAEYLEGTEVTLLATADPGSEFVDFSGDCGPAECELVMNEDHSVTATFDLEPAFYTLTVSKNGSGSGTVTSPPAGISCGGDCEESYLEGTLVKLTGTPDAGSKAVEWESCPGTVNGENKCEVTMDAAKEAKATFDKEPVFYTLGISTGGSGSGTVECEVEGGPAEACEAEYLEGTEVTLLATADPGSEFVDFSGDCGPAECELVMNEDHSVTATFDLEVPPAGECTGSDITGEGSSLQFNAQDKVRIPGFQGPGGLCFEKGTEPEVTYLGTGSGAGLNAWDFNGPDETPFDTSRAFTASDEAPDTAQLGNAETAAGGSKALVIPVAQTAIGAVVNPPAGCEIEEITNKQLESVFRGNIKFWGKIQTASGPGCAGSPVTRVVRPDGSGTTFQFKNYLHLINKGKLACTSPSATWQELMPIGAEGKPNTTWPENGVGGCSGTALSPIVTAAGSGGSALVKKVNATGGSIGYAALPDIEASKEGDTGTVEFQNNGLVKLANATFANPATEASNANCTATDYTVPVDGRVGGGSGESVDWSGVFGANLKINSENYPLCALTYDMALAEYGKKAGFTEGQAQTVEDYLAGYVTTAAGQEDVATAGQFYAALPSSASPALDVRGAAQLAASKIGF